MSQRILLLTKNYPPQIGGIEKYSYETYRTLKLENNVILVKSGTRNEKLFSNKSNFTYFLLYLSSEIFRLIIFFFRSLFYIPFQVKSVDLVWGMDASLSPLVYFLSKIYSCESRITGHALDIVWDNKIYQLIMPFFWTRIDKFICLNEKFRDILAKKGLNSAKIIISPHTIDSLHLPVLDNFSKELFLLKYGIPNNKILLLSLGRFVEKKGFHWFLSEVMPYVDNQKFHYILVGGGPFEKLYKNIISSKKIDNISMLGIIKDPLEKASLFMVSNYFIMPTVQTDNDCEGQPLVLLEAQYYNLKCILSNFIHLPDNIDSNIILPEKNSSAWINFLISVGNHYRSSH